MAGKRQSRGKCAFCGKEMTRGGMLKHLATCAARQHAIGEADTRPGSIESIFHLQVKDAWGGDYWLNLEMPGSATLKNLDGYLRGIWLECCGHLSGYSTGREGDAVSMKARVDRAFLVGTELLHTYDYGTSSKTLIKAVDVRKGKALTSHPVALMARNIMPEQECMECEQPAKWLCDRCLMEGDESGMLCEEHMQTHPHEEYAPTLVVNSPRMGMCGYDGSAEPPY